ncbi:radical SAM protein [Candidatus Poribacteria bacterium]|nr:radical SAM protein [Candidatus Poribacteria bacterium]
MRILLIDPPFQRFMRFKCDWFPLGIGYLAAVLRNRGHDVRIYNAEFHDKQRYLRSSELLSSFNLYLDALGNNGHAVWKEIGETIRRYAPDVVGITAPTVKFASAVSVAAISKKLFPHAPVIMGGPHSTNCAREVLSRGELDIVVHGEGETTIVELIDALGAKSDLRNVQGISYKNPDGVITHNRTRTLIDDLDSIPFPARDLLLGNRVVDPENMGNMITTRGCPFRCTYCAAHTVWTHKVRYRSVDNVIEEIRFIREKFGTRQFTFWDDCFTLRKNRTLEFCEAIRSEQLDVKWGCNTRFDLLDEELISEMKLAGCNNVEVGVESGSPRILEAIKKGETLEKMREVAEMLNRNEIYWSAFFMIGFPQEDISDIARTLESIDTLRPCWCTFSIFTPYPGTELYENSVKTGLFPQDRDWSQFSHQSPHNSFTLHMSPGEFSEITRTAIRKFERYNRKPSLLLKKAKTRASLYYSSPKTLVGDSRKLVDWLGIT